MDENRLEELKKYFENIFRDIEKLTEYELKINCLFSVLDSLAQAKYNYQKDIKENGRRITPLEKFIGDYFKSSDLLEKIDPITLLYHIDREDAIDIEKFDLQWNVSTDNIYDYCNIDVVNSSPEKIKYQHTYLSLLLQLRNKCSHEMQSPNFLKLKKKMDLPFYDLVGHPSFDGNGIHREFIYLTFPLSFVIKVVKECMNNYFEECMNKNIDPFENNFDRKVFLTWYN